MKQTRNFALLFPAITPMVQNAKTLSASPQNGAAANNWRKTNQQVRKKERNNLKQEWLLVC